jgi:hypothetical protein
VAGQGKVSDPFHLGEIERALSHAVSEG